MEQRAQQLIKQHLGMDILSYEKTKSAGLTGYMDIYLKYSKNNHKMSTSADHNVMLELASIDQFRNRNILTKL